MSTGHPAINYDNRFPREPLIYPRPLRPPFPPLCKIVPNKRRGGSAPPYHGTGSNLTCFRYIRTNNRSRELYSDQLDGVSPKPSSGSVTFTQADVNLVLYGRDYLLSSEESDKLPLSAELDSGECWLYPSNYRAFLPFLATPSCVCDVKKTDIAGQAKCYISNKVRPRAHSRDLLWKIRFSDSGVKWDRIFTTPAH